MRAFALLLALLLAGCGGGGHTQAPDAPPALVATYGDSTQAAQGNPHAATRPGYTIDNRGVSGLKAVNMVPGWRAEMAASKAHIVVLNPGINDRGLPLAGYRANLMQLVQDARDFQKLVVLEQPNAIDEPGFEDFRQTMRDVATHMGVYFCEQPRVPLADGIHPDAEGYAIKAQRLAKCIGEVL